MPENIEYRDLQILRLKALFNIFIRHPVKAFPGNSRDLGGELVLLVSLAALVTWCMPASAQNLRFEEKQFFSSLFQFKYMITEDKRK